MTSDASRPDSGRDLASLVGAIEPRDPRPLRSLIDRLGAIGDAGLRGARSGGRPIGPAALARLEVRGITADSRLVRPGWLFVALAGFHDDGHAHLADAGRAGAAAAVVERPVPEDVIPQLVVGSSRRSLATCAAWWYGDPSRSLAVVGVTGTDGKTTTSLLSAAALAATGIPTGLVGTVVTDVGGRRFTNDVHMTTPEAPELQALLRAMVAGGDGAAVLETTSHALALDRVAEVAYDAAIVTNVSHEHLDLHGSFEAYRAAKLSLFERLAERAAPVRPRAGIVGRDDPSSGLFEAVTREAGARLVTYAAGGAADVRATRIVERDGGLAIRVETPRGPADLRLRLGGRFNALNALAAIALGEAWELDAAAVRRGIESVASVPGRMERIDLGQPFTVIVDFAHSPASLTAVLDDLAPAAAAAGGGLIVVFGSAGERDVAKRRAMGRIAGERCRLVVLTDEDPRGEDGDAILDAIARGAEDAGRRRGRDVLLIRDRATAIDEAVERARPGDVVVLAGKGHEQSIIGPDGPRPWDERAAAIEAIRRRGHGTA